MICKWCGAEIQPSYKNCPVCGRELPAMSDCGGFYDIVPSAARPTASQIPPSPTPKVDCEPVSSPHSAVPSAGGRGPGSEPPIPPKKHSISSIVIPAALIVLAVFTLIQSIRLSSRISALEQEMLYGKCARFSQSQYTAPTEETEVSQTDSTAGESTSETGEPTLAEQTDSETISTEPVNPLLSREEIKFIVNVFDNEEEITADAYEPNAIQKESYREDNKRSIDCSLNGKYLWTAGLSPSANNNDLGDAIGLGCTVTLSLDSNVFGSTSDSDSVKFCWEYRQGEEWVDLDDDENVLIVSDDAGSTLIVIQPSELYNKIEAYGRQIKCIMTHHSVDGGVVKIEFIFKGSFFQ